MYEGLEKAVWFYCCIKMSKLQQLKSYKPVMHVSWHVGTVYF